MIIKTKESASWLIGAVAGELLHEKQNLEKAIAVGFGSLISFLVGSGLKLIVTGFMRYYIIIDLV